MLIDVIIPAFNEANAVGKVIAEIPAFVRNIIVVNNNSNDDTRKVSLNAGAIVLDEPQKGYGKACLKGIAYLEGLKQSPDVVVFLDADYSDYPEEMVNILEPIFQDNADMVIGSRAKGSREYGAMTLPQVFGNWLATKLMFKLFKADFSDLGPFRAIRWNKLKALNMQDEDYGWTIEMQIKAVKNGLSYTEVPVNYRKRIGVSKVSGTIKGVFGAGYKILWTIWKYR
ncbi:glycosyltransferase family 2 protein [Cyclobacterium marinum]|uniref:Glycosyl transferase family 2 n=1 Tax=Cyclobacterium marinum (strain ATCC 25205 / DSM 745 / LMG 13164 / NCIMB 1802) TaxID=880070 RepID=G0J2W3_CYCMS|nr:glycosyltransferase family 2 protein [Cyclobacterium marinum]AEL27450.1 glycosyl transferase family 2 [Cyclobacterium marinum DSM 745]